MPNAPGLGNPWLHPFLRCITVPIHCFWSSGPNSRNCEVRWRETYKPLLRSGEDKSMVRHKWSTSLCCAAEVFCTGKLWPMLLAHDSTDCLLWPGRGQHIIQFILTLGAATLLSSTVKDSCLSFGSVFLNVLPQFCTQQPSEGPEQPIRLPWAHCCSW